jgi:hypothetical protein
VSIDGDAARRACPEAVVEDLQRQEPIESGRVQRKHEIVDGKVALSRETSIVPTPGQVIHVKLRRIGHLHEKDPV